MGNYNNAAPCPACGKSDANKVGYTWWGGLVGPLLLSHVKCNQCGVEYNGKSGQSNTTNIMILYVAVFVIAFIVYFVLGAT